MLSSIEEGWFGVRTSFSSSFLLPPFFQNSKTQIVIPPSYVGIRVLHIHAHLIFFSNRDTWNRMRSFFGGTWWSKFFFWLQPLPSSPLWSMAIHYSRRPLRNKQSPVTHFFLRTDAYAAGRRRFYLSPLVVCRPPPCIPVWKRREGGGDTQSHKSHSLLLRILYTVCDFLV